MIASKRERETDSRAIQREIALLICRIYLVECSMQCHQDNTIFATTFNVYSLVSFQFSAFSTSRLLGRWAEYANANGVKFRVCLNGTFELKNQCLWFIIYTFIHSSVSRSLPLSLSLAFSLSLALANRHTVRYTRREVEKSSFPRNAVETFSISFMHFLW